MTSFLGGGLRLVAVSEGRGTFNLPWRHFLRRLWSVGPCDRLRGSCARERGMLSGGLVVPTRVFLQTRCSSRCRAVSVGAALRWRWTPHGSGPSGGGVCPLASFFGGGLRSRVRYLHECGLWVKLRFCSCLFCHRLCAVPGHVDVPIQPVGECS
jgi:hypothetical protein